MMMSFFCTLSSLATDLENLGRRISLLLVVAIKMTIAINPVNNPDVLLRLLELRLFVLELTLLVLTQKNRTKAMAPMIANSRIKALDYWIINTFIELT